jgi:Zn-finger nucleic acid-binding protein
MARVVKCPRDGTEATIEEHDGRHGRFRIDVCPTCGGVWFDQGEIGRLTNDREIERMIVAYASGASKFACPGCGGAVARRPVGDVTLDVCTSCHGVWMDRGELETAARTLAGEQVSLSGDGAAPGGVARAEALAMAAFASPRALRVMLRPPKPSVPENL